ncbi:hypothetical protein PENFLA_c087G03995 [Penicillium flavigenum]|uniref:Uncharacterized protein n=1 Tax=Penicillium flavigenum TaxID=254877 RepID=A0A1V6SA17_9EURO|nr:hypothetical protein PENFLA_c087G03995 [Penicillium flavigenum]
MAINDLEKPGTGTTSDICPSCLGKRGAFETEGGYDNTRGEFHAPYFSAQCRSCYGEGIAAPITALEKKLEMDEWNISYLQSWQADFGDEPDAQHSLRFLKDILLELKGLSHTESAKTTDSSPETVASSIIATIKSQKNTDAALEDFQAVLFGAATSSLLDPSDLAKVTRLLINCLPAPFNKKLEHQISSNARERWNVGPEKPSPGKEIDQCIEEWISLNAFVAHLTRVHAVSLEDYGLRTLNRAFDAGAHLEDERIYYVPAAAAWVNILGGNIYLWSSQNAGDSGSTGFKWPKWDEWRRGFETSSKSDKFASKTRKRAEMALYKMNELDKAGHS